jgi:hypothetical protein
MYYDDSVEGSLAEVANPYKVQAPIIPNQLGNHELHDKPRTV